MSEPRFDCKNIGHIHNFYGGLYVMEHEGKYYWIIEGHDTDFDDLAKWEEIDQQLYDSLLRHEFGTEGEPLSELNQSLPDRPNLYTPSELALEMLEMLEYVNETLEKNPMPVLTRNSSFHDDLRKLLSKIDKPTTPPTPKTNDSYTYETKCKRCGTVKEWYAGGKEDFQRASFMEYIIAKSRYMEHGYCDTCGLDTFRELISFSMPD